MGFLASWQSTTYLANEVASVSDATAELLGDILDVETAAAVSSQEADGAAILADYEARVDVLAVDNPEIAGIKDPDYSGLTLLTAFADTAAWGVAYASSNEIAPSVALIRSEWEANFDPPDLDDRGDLAHLDDATVDFFDDQAWVT